MHFFKTHDFYDACSNSAFRRDWRSSGHLLKGLGPHASDPGSPKWLPEAPLRSRRTTQRTVVIGARPAPHITSKWASGQDGVHIFKNTCVFAYVCCFRRFVVIRVRPAPSFDQRGASRLDGVHISTKANVHHAWAFSKTRAPLRREIRLGRLDCLLEAPGPLVRPGPKGTQKALQGHCLGRLGVSLGCPLWEASGPQKAPQSRLKDGASMRPVTPN